MTFNGWKEVVLEEVSYYGDEKIPSAEVTLDNYISTENMLPNKSGVGMASGLPTTKSVRRYKKGDILLSNIRPYFKKIWFATKNGGCSNDVLVIKNKDEKELDKKYLYYTLLQDNFFDYVTATSKGTKMPRGDKSAIMNYGIMLPPLNEQKAIANILSTLDEKIETNNQINEKLEEMAQALFKHWFVDFEFPNENGEPYKSSGGEMVESELGEIPKGWKVDKLSSIAEIIMGQSPKSDTYNTDKIGLPLLNGATDFQNKNLSPSKYTSDPKKVGEKGDFVFGVRATIGLVTELDDRYAIGRGSGIARAFDNMYKEFLYEILNIAFSNFQYTASGSVYLNVSKNDLEDYKLVIPDINILRRYHKITKSILNQKENLKRENAVLEKLRDTLLPKLMSGEIRVPLDNETLVEQS
ncbi:restriction endonuclease subunit S [Aeribacillus alveayuensis]|uniref:Type I restriction enzyme S subunit n=1 Tax=Aeribacillus alveayuensis TaxID=279215 RepID=A0ABT9VQY4_9BACI|nr:type I restriction enzyme S subunit [Bacillus alveayuensis]